MLLFLILYTLFSPLALACFLKGVDVYNIPNAQQIVLVLVGGPLCWGLTLFFLLRAYLYK